MKFPPDLERALLEGCIEEQRQRCESELGREISATMTRLGREARENNSEAVLQLSLGTYGYCIDCYEPLSTARLEATWFTVRCADCDRLRTPERLNLKN